MQPDRELEREPAFWRVHLDPEQLVKPRKPVAEGGDVQPHRICASLVPAAVIEELRERFDIRGPVLLIMRQDRANRAGDEGADLLRIGRGEQHGEWAEIFRCQRAMPVETPRQPDEPDTLFPGRRMGLDAAERLAHDHRRRLVENPARLLMIFRMSARQRSSDLLSSPGTRHTIT